MLHYKINRKQWATLVKVASCLLLLLGLLGMAGVFSTGCKTKTVQQRRTERGAQMISDLEFRRHEKSGLCFAVYGESHGSLLAHVPCDRVKTPISQGR